MGHFRVVQVINDRNVFPDWVARALEDANIEFSVNICWSKNELAWNAGDADLVWAFGGRPGLLVGENLDVLNQCKVILRTGSGTDNIDIKSATDLGILVVNTPEVTAEPVSDHTIGLLFSLIRQTPRLDRMVRQGIWDPWQHMTGQLLTETTLGLVGFGNIPKRIVRRLAGFDMTFLVHDPYVADKEICSQGATKVSLDELLHTANYVSLHCPLTRDTYHLIGAREFRLMQPHAFLINTSRGGVIDEQALVSALEQGQIAGAALDVLEKEPPDPDYPLLTMDNVIITPHVGGFSHKNYPQEYLEVSVKTIIGISKGQWPNSVVNPQVTPRWEALSGCNVPRSRREKGDSSHRK